MKKIILPLAVLILSACQGHDFAPNGDASGLGAGIVGGTTVKPSQPEAKRVHLLDKITYQKDSSGTWIPARRGLCTVSLIGRRLVIAAGHCLIAQGTRGSLTVKFLQNDGSTKNIAVVDWQRHPSEDLALMELKSDAPKGTEILSLPEAGVRYEVEKVEAAGYGRMDGRPSEDGKMRVLRKTTLETFGYDQEEERFRVDQTEGRGFCQGDSGGPGTIMVDGKRILIGIAAQTTYLDESDLCSLAGLYVNVPVYLDWIKEATDAIQSSTERPSGLIVE